MHKRPIAVKVYCIAIGALLLVGLLLISLPYIASGRGSLADVALGFVPMAVLLPFLWGVWQLRWWGVAGLSVVVVAVEGLLIASAPQEQGFAAAFRGALWLIPLWWIAWSHRELFR